MSISMEQGQKDAAMNAKGNMKASEQAEKQCLIGAVVAVLLILLAGTVLVYRTSVSAEAAQDRPAALAAAE
ncbi:hypothetical protein BH10PSE13_BH10PSE13_10230 [soil metagenome]